MPDTFQDFSIDRSSDGQNWVPSTPPTVNASVRYWDDLGADADPANSPTKKWIYRLRETTANNVVVPYNNVSIGLPGQVFFLKGFGGTSYNYGYAVAVRPNGNIVMAGAFNGTTDFGKGNLTNSGGSYDIFMAEYSPDATTCLWANRYGSSTGAEVARGLALAADGSIFMAGQFTGTADVGFGSWASAGGNDIFLAKYSATGDPIWGKHFPGSGSDPSSGDDQVNGIAIDISGNIFLTGTFSGTCLTHIDGSVTGGILFDDPPLTGLGNRLCSGNGSAITFVAKLSGSDGSRLWSFALTDFGQADNFGKGIVVGSDNAAIVAGSVVGDVDFGKGNISNAGLAAYAVKYAGAGPDKSSCVWGRLFGGVGPYGDRAVDAAVDTAGDVWVTGSFANATINLGNGWSLTNTHPSKNAAVVAKLSGADGSTLFAMGSTSSNWLGSADPLAVAVDSSNNAIVTGTFANNMTMAGQTLTGAGAENAFIAKLTSAGVLSWIRAFTGRTSSAQVGGLASQCLAADGLNNIVLSGTVLGTGDINESSLTSHSSFDAFLLKLTP